MSQNSTASQLEHPVIRLNVKEFMKTAIDLNLRNDTQIAAKIGVSVTQLWRVKLPPDHPHYNAPGPVFIAKVLNTFGGPFEKFFFLEETDTSSYQKEKE